MNRGEPSNSSLHSNDSSSESLKADELRESSVAQGETRDSQANEEGFEPDNASVTSKDPRFMRLIPLMREGAEIPVDMERLTPRQARSHGEVQIATVSFRDASGKIIKKSIAPIAHAAFGPSPKNGRSEGLLVTPIIRKIGGGKRGGGEYAVILEVESPTTGQPTEFISYQLACDGRLRVMALPRSNAEYEGKIPVEEIPRVESPVAKEISIGIITGRMPDRYRRISRRELDEWGLLTQTQGAIYFWKPSVRIDTPHNMHGDYFLRLDPAPWVGPGAWAASLWSEGDSRVGRPELPLRDMVLYSDAQGLTSERPYPSAGIGYEKIQGEIPSVKRTFRDLLTTTWPLYWLANGGPHVPPDESVKPERHRQSGQFVDPYLYNFEGETIQPELGDEFAHGEVIRSCVSFSETARGLRYTCVRDGEVVATRHVVVVHDGQFHRPALVSVDGMNVGVPEESKTRDVDEVDIHEDFHSSLRPEERFLILKTRHAMWEEMSLLSGRIGRALELPIEEKAGALRSLREALADVSQRADDLARVQTTGSYDECEYLREKLRFSRTPTYRPEVIDEPERVARFQELIAAVLDGRGGAESLSALTEEFGRRISDDSWILPLCELPVKFSGRGIVTTRVHPAGDNRIREDGDRSPAISLSSYPKETVLLSVSVESKGTLGKSLRVRVFHPDHLDEPWDSAYFDPRIGQFVSSREEWQRYFGGERELGVPGDMVVGHINQGDGRINLFRSVDIPVTDGFSKKAWGFIPLGDIFYQQVDHGTFFPFQTRGDGPRYYALVDQQDPEVVRVYGSPTLRPQDELGAFRWIADSEEWKTKVGAGSGFGEAASGPLKDLKVFGVEDRVWNAMREWVSATSAPKRYMELAARVEIGTRNKVTLPEPLGVARPNSAQLSIPAGHGNHGDRVFLRTVTETEEVAVDLYSKTGSFLHRAFYSREIPEGVGALTEASRRFHMLRTQIAEGRCLLPDPILFARPGSAKTGQFDLIDKTRGKSAKRSGSNVIFNLFSDCERAHLPEGFQVDLMWLEYSTVRVSVAQICPAINAICVDLSRRQAQLTCRAVELSEGRFRYDILPRSQDVTGEVFAKMDERGYLRSVDSVVYPDILRRLVERLDAEITIAERPREGVDAILDFASRSLLDHTLESHRFSRVVTNWSDAYFYFAGKNFREEIGRKAGAVLDTFAERYDRPLSFLQGAAVQEFLTAVSGDGDLMRLFEVEPWRLDPLEELQEEVQRATRGDALRHDAVEVAFAIRDIARSTVLLASSDTLVSVCTPLPSEDKGNRRRRPARMNTTGVAPMEIQPVEWVPIPEVVTPRLSPVPPPPLLDTPTPVPEDSEVPTTQELVTAANLQFEPVRLRRGQIIQEPLSDTLLRLDARLFVTMPKVAAFHERLEMLAQLRKEYEGLLDLPAEETKRHPLPDPDLGKVWGEYKERFAKVQPSVRFLLERKPDFTWPDEDALPTAARKVMGVLRETVGTIHEESAAFSHVWVELAPVEYRSGSRRPAIFLVGVDYRNGRASKTYQILERSKNEFQVEGVAFGAADQFRHPVFESILQHGYRLFEEPSKRDVLIRHRLDLIDAQVASHHGPWDEIEEGLAAYERIPFEEHLLLGRVSHGASSCLESHIPRDFSPGPSVFGIPFFLRSEALGPLFTRAHRLTTTSAQVTRAEAVALLDTFVDAKLAKPLTMILGCHRSRLGPILRLHFLLTRNKSQDAPLDDFEHRSILRVARVLEETRCRYRSDLPLSRLGSSASKKEAEPMESAEGDVVKDSAAEVTPEQVGVDGGMPPIVSDGEVSIESPLVEAEVEAEPAELSIWEAELAEAAADPRIGVSTAKALMDELHACGDSVDTLAKNEILEHVKNILGIIADGMSTLPVDEPADRIVWAHYFSIFVYLAHEESQAPHEIGELVRHAESVLGDSPEELCVGEEIRTWYRSKCIAPLEQALRKSKGGAEGTRLEVELERADSPHNLVLKVARALRRVDERLSKVEIEVDTALSVGQLSKDVFVGNKGYFVSVEREIKDLAIFGQSAKRDILLSRLQRLEETYWSKRASFEVRAQVDGIRESIRTRREPVEAVEGRLNALAIAMQRNARLPEHSRRELVRTLAEVQADLVKAKRDWGSVARQQGENESSQGSRTTPRREPRATSAEASRGAESTTRKTPAKGISIPAGVQLNLSSEAATAHEITSKTPQGRGSPRETPLVDAMQGFLDSLTAEAIDISEVHKRARRCELVYLDLASRGDYSPSQVVQQLFAVTGPLLARVKAKIEAAVSGGQGSSHRG